MLFTRKSLYYVKAHRMVHTFPIESSRLLVTRRQRILVSLVLTSAVVLLGYDWVTTGGIFSWSPNDLSQSDPRIIQKIREKYLVPPSNLPYNLRNAETIHHSQFNQSRIVAEIVKNKRNGFFVEAGAYAGEFLENTLYFERELGWNGLLIEADPSLFAELATKRRKAWSTCSCLSLRMYPTKVSFELHGSKGHGRISELQPGHNEEGFVDVQCFPFYSYMLALNQTRVDYFSLDIEGDELDVLRTIPFDKIHISVLTVEFSHGQDKQVMKTYMERNGYYTHGTSGEDFVFVKRGSFS